MCKKYIQNNGVTALNSLPAEVTRFNHDDEEDFWLFKDGAFCYCFAMMSVFEKSDTRYALPKTNINHF